MNREKKENLKNYGIVILGSLIFAIGVNLFIVPAKLYNGGVIGIAQIIRTILANYIDLPTNVDIAGIINFGLNIPLFLLAYKSISPRFFGKTVVSIICQTIFFTLITVPTNPIVDDVLAACIIGGIISAAGIGIILQAGGSGGGIDVLGVYFAKKYPGLSYGKVGMSINTVIFGLCAFLFQLPTAIYSVIQTVFFCLIVDRIHIKNINTTAMIFTKKEKVEDRIMKEMIRGVTVWNGHGAYTGDDTKILMTVISKYEIPQLKKLVLEVDSKAFIIFNEGLNVTGNFEKRLL